MNTDLRERVVTSRDSEERRLFIKGNVWKFNEIPRVEERMFNPLLERFYDYGLSAFVRENIQNSLDACLLSGTTIKIKIKIGTIQTEVLPGIKEIRERINSLEGYSTYSKDTIEHMKESCEQRECSYITFEDENTKGLNKSNWNTYAYEKGSHCEVEDETLENLRGGSHGVGKIASNSASDINLMFFANCDDKSNECIGGTIQLIEHDYNGKTYRSTGYFTDRDECGEFLPYKNSFLSEIFKKNTRGLKIIVPFLRDGYDDDNEIVRAVCDNFFVAILENKLTVNVNELEINKTTIKDIICNVEIYENQQISEMVKNFTPLYVKTYLEQESTVITVADKYKDYKFHLYFDYNNEIKKGRVAVIRTIGMKIQDLLVKGYAKGPFNAVLIPYSHVEDSVLKGLENESHTKISADNIKDKAMKQNAKRFINNLNKAISEIIDNKIKEENPTDGAIDTSDILYTVENTFRKALSGRASTVSITPSGKGKKELIIKKDKNEKVDNGSTKKKENQEAKDIRNRDKVGDDGEKKVFTKPLKANQVRRIVVGGKERLVLDLNKDSLYEGQKRCQLHFEVIDGAGKTSGDSLHLNQQYKVIVDGLNKSSYIFDGNRIKDVSINGGIINLDMDIVPGSNHALKYNYTVEVDR